MNRPVIRAFVQARMSSARFPGKVLAPFNGKPVIAHVIAEVKRVLPTERVVVTTSTESSDDPLACYVRQLGISVFRGSLDHVVERFQKCLKEYPCTWFFRICADSPLLDSALLQTMMTYGDRSDIDLVTNIYPRTFPTGRSLEMLYATTFGGLNSGRLSEEEKEHVTKVYYDHPKEFRIINLRSADPLLAETALAIDTIEDLRRLERWVQDNPSLAEGAPSVAGKRL